MFALQSPTGEADKENLKTSKKPTSIPRTLAALLVLVLV